MKNLFKVFFMSLFLTTLFAQTYSVTISETSNGTISIEDDQGNEVMGNPVDGSKVLIKITPNTDYVIKDVKVGIAGATPASTGARILYTIESIDANYVIDASFMADGPVWDNSTANTLVYNNGTVAIGTTADDIDTQYALSVKGKMRAQEIKITDVPGWEDRVFEKDYKLATLEEVEQFIAENGHLSDIPSEKEVMEKGVSVAEMNAMLLRKIEELTLYVIKQQQMINEQTKMIEDLKSIKYKAEKYKY